MSGSQLECRLVGSRQWDRLGQEGDCLADIDGALSQGQSRNGIEEGVDFLAQAAGIGLLPQLLQELLALGFYYNFFQPVLHTRAKGVCAVS